MSFVDYIREKHKQKITELPRGSSVYNLLTPDKRPAHYETMLKELESIKK